LLATSSTSSSSSPSSSLSLLLPNIELVEQLLLVEHHKVESKLGFFLADQGLTEHGFKDIFDILLGLEQVANEEDSQLL